MAGKPGPPSGRVRSRLRFIPCPSIAAYLSLAVASGVGAASYGAGRDACGTLDFGSPCPAIVRSLQAFTILWIVAAVAVAILMVAAASPPRSRRLRIPNQILFGAGIFLFGVGAAAVMIPIPRLQLTFGVLYLVESLLLLALTFLDPPLEHGYVSDGAVALALLHGIAGLLLTGLVAAVALTPGLYA